MYLGTLFGTTWGYPGLLEAILDHLGGILGPKASETPPGWQCLCPGIAILSHFGVNFGTANWYLFGKFWGHFVDHLSVPFWNTFGIYFRPILGSDRPKKGAR